MYLSVLEVVSPKWPDFVLAADVPDGETDVLVLHGLDVESDGGDSRHDLAQLELVQDGGLTSSIKPDCGKIFKCGYKKNLI